ncbi:MAG: glycyl-radical enzyme activating protein [Deltaproteobacteria bacterium]|nr:glycyl-radical enzyme activating protein [Deltaproteobacteria bacterium]
MVGRVFDIQRFSIHDGPGIRTLVFFKGCPIRCQWCSNPESQNKGSDLMYYTDRCVRCGKCVKACESGNLTLESGENGRETSLRINRRECRGCGQCVSACPNEAMRLAGYEISYEEVFEIIKKDFPFYFNSGGGVTLGGGEPTAQPEFALGILKKCKSLNIHTAMETCGYVAWGVFNQLLDYLDLVFFDIKHIHPERHKNFTGVSNKKILNNVKQLLKKEVRTILRIPLVTGINDDFQEIEGIANFLIGIDHKGLQHIELLPYHKLGVAKYEYLQRKYDLIHLEPPSQRHVMNLKDLMISFGFSTRIQGIGYPD